MGGSKPKPSAPLPFEQKQQSQNTFGLFSIADTPEAKDFLGLPLDFGGNNYAGDAYKDYTGQAYKDYSGQAYKDIKDNFKFNVDPGVARRGALAEQGVMNRWDNALMGGVPAFLKTQAKARDLRETRGQNAAEAQQAEYTRQNAQQQADYQSSLARAQMRDDAERSLAQMRDDSERTRASMRDAAELNRAQMLDRAASARTATDVERRRLLLPTWMQTGGSGNTSGFNTQLAQQGPGFLSSFGQGLGSGLGSALPFI